MCAMRHLCHVVVEFGGEVYRSCWTLWSCRHSSTWPEPSVIQWPKVYPVGRPPTSWTRRPRPPVPLYVHDRSSSRGCKDSGGERRQRCRLRSEGLERWDIASERRGRRRRRRKSAAIVFREARRAGCRRTWRPRPARLYAACELRVLL